MIRACVYKGCENYVLNNVLCGNKPFSLFTFPRKPERRKQWMELGQVSPKVPKTQLYFCSEHFDKKYWSVNQRRVVLVGAALPYEYRNAAAHDETATIAEAEEGAGASEEEVLHIQNMGNEESYEENAFVTMSRLEEEVESTEVLDLVDDKEYQVASTTMRYDGDEERECEVVEREEEEEPTDEEELLQEGVLFECGDYETENNAMTEAMTCRALPIKAQKRKLIEVDHTPAPSKAKVLLNKFNQGRHSRSNAQVASAKVHGAPKPSKAENKSSKESLVDSQYVTTFIFKGEEYVQMSREYYEQDKLQLLEKLKQYEKVLRNCKQELNTLNLS